MVQPTPRLESRSIPDFTADHQGYALWPAATTGLRAFRPIVLAVCVRFVFGIAAASRKTRFQAPTTALPGRTCTG